MTAINHADAVRLGAGKADRVYAGSTLVWQAFKPTDLNGCVVWQDASTISAPNGASLSSWPNLGSGSSPLIIGSPYPTFRTNALNTNMPCVRVTRGQGRYRWSGLNVNKEYTLFIVARRWQLTGGRILTVLSTAANALWGWHGNEFECAYQEGWFTTPGPVGGITSTAQWRMYSADGSASSTSRLFGFGTLLGQHPSPPATLGLGGTLNISGYTNDTDIAASQQADCEIAELIVYNRKLPDAERQKVERHLMSKWNPISLFKPTDLGSNLVAWFDAKDASSVQCGTGPSRGAYYGVYNWVNKGVGPMTLTQYTDAQRPLYTSGQSVNFATGEIMNPANAPASFDMLVVATPNPQGDWRTLIRSVGGHELILESTSTRYGVYSNGFAQAGGLTWPAQAGLAYVRAAPSTVTTMSRDGGAMTSTGVTLPATSAAPTMFGGYISGPSQAFGQVREVIFVPYNLEGARQMLEGYAAHKWGYAGLLPVGHPYKITPP